MKLNRILFIIFSFCLTSLNSQILEPVKWNFEKNQISENQYELVFIADIDPNWAIYNKAVLYHMFHSIAILILGLINKIQPEIQLSMAGWSFVFGIILFSGSLYILAITGIKSLGMITPIGGVFFIIGWIFLIIRV